MENQRKGKYYDVKHRQNRSSKEIDPWSGKDEGCIITTGLIIMINILFLIFWVIK